MKWIKSLGIWAILGGCATAALMFLRAYQAGKMEAQIDQQEDHIKELSRGTDADIAQAKVKQAEIKVLKIEARSIRKKSEAAQEQIGKNETMASIAGRFNSGTGRVRRKSPPIATVRSGGKKSGKRNVSH